MHRSACLLIVASLFLGCQSREEGPQVRPTTAAYAKLPDGVYAVRRDSVREQEVLPLQDGEALVVNRQRYAKQDPGEAPRHVVVRATPDVLLDLAGAPEAVTEGGEVVRILLKLQPDAAAALERLTAIHGGEVQISSCVPGAAGFLLDQLRARAGRNP